MKSTWLAFVLVAGCAHRAMPEATLGRTIDATADVRVYAWTGDELAGLYCRVAGVLDHARCDWPARLALAFEPAPGRQRHLLDRRQLDDDVVKVVSYGGTARVVLVVETARGTTAWIAEDEGLRRIVDESGVAVHAVPTLRGIGVKGDPEPPADAEVPAYEVAGVAALDLDGNGVLEVIYRGLDDGGWFVAAAELGADDGFAVQLPAR